MKIGLLLLLWLIGYIVVTWVGIGHTIFNIKVLHMKSMKESEGLGEGYERTKLWHPLRLSFKQFYIEYQPWITLIYVAIFLGPVIGYFMAGHM